MVDWETPASLGPSPVPAVGPTRPHPDSQSHPIPLSEAACHGLILPLFLSPEAFPRNEK